LVGLSARRKELAIYRSLGAGPYAIFMAVAWESFLVCSLAIAAGVLGTQLLIVTCQELLLQNFGIQTHNGWPEPEAWYSIGLLLAGAMMASLLPAWRAYRISLLDGLHPPN